MGNLAGDHVYLIAVGDGQYHVRILDTGLLQHVGVRGMARDGADVTAFLERRQQMCILVDYGDVIGLVRKCLSDGAADLTGPKDNDFHTDSGFTGTLSAASRTAGTGSAG